MLSESNTGVGTKNSSSNQRAITTNGACFMRIIDNTKKSLSFTRICLKSNLMKRKRVHLHENRISKIMICDEILIWNIWLQQHRAGSVFLVWETPASMDLTKHYAFTMRRPSEMTKANARKSVTDHFMNGDQN